MRLKEKVIFIADANTPRGAAVAGRAISEGASVIINYPGKLPPAPNEDNAIFVSLPLDNENEMENGLKGALDIYGHIDAMFYDHAEVIRAGIEVATLDFFNENLRLNILSAFICTKVVGKIISETGGKIVYAGSIHDEKPTGCAFLYSCAMGSLKNLAKEAALYFGYKGVDTVYVEIGPVSGGDKAFKSDISTFYEAYNYKIPSRYIGNNEDLAALVSWLLCDECRYLNGAEIRMDGGLVLHYLDDKLNNRLTIEGILP